LKIDTNRDGIDIDACRNVRVSNCTVNSPFDDGICPKSSFALGYARATENVPSPTARSAAMTRLATVGCRRFKRNYNPTVASALVIAADLAVVMVTFSVARA